MAKHIRLFTIFLVVTILVANVIPTLAQDGNEPYDPVIDPANFVEGIDNPFFPLTPGTMFVYEGESDGEFERIETVVLYETREILGIECVIVRDTVWQDDELVEDTFDWYAQDVDGNVWYMGEASTDYENGEPVSTEGSWEAGVNGAKPGIIMWADPEVGEPYRQEYYEGEAEDMAQIVDVEGIATLEYGEFENLVTIYEWNPLDPDALPENKYYAEGIGLILEEIAETGEGRIELIDVITDISEDEIDDMREDIGDSDDGDDNDSDDGDENDDDDGEVEDDDD